jgi:hypothetical protein
MHPSLPLASHLCTVCMQDSTFQIFSTRQTFFNSTLFPTTTSAPFVNDPFQYQGVMLSTDLTKCPQPLSSNRGSQYCLMSCLNTCPELNPDQKAESLKTLAYINALLPNIDDALNASSIALSIVTKPVQIFGAVAFPAPPGTSADDLNTVVGLITSQLPTILPYNITFQVCLRLNLHHHSLVSFRFSSNYSAAHRLRATVSHAALQPLCLPPRSLP